MQPTPVPQPRLRPWVVPVGIALVVSLVVVVTLLPWMLRHLSWPTVMSESADSTPATPAVLSSDYAEPGATYGAKPAKPAIPQVPTVVQAGLVAPSTNGTHPPPPTLLPKPAPGQAAIPTAVLQQTPAAPVAMQPTAPPPGPTPRVPGVQQTPQTPAGTSKPPGHWGIELTHAQQRGERRPPTRKEVEDLSRLEAARSLIKQAIWAQPGQPRKTLYRQQAIPGVTIDEMVSDIPGQYKIRVSVPVFDRFERTVELIPKDSIIIITQKRVPGYGEKRLELVVEEIQPPTPEVISLKAGVGDKEGAAGVGGKVDNHIPQLVLATLISTAINIGGRVAAGNPQGYQYSVGQEVVREGGQQVSQDAKSIVDRTLRIPPTITVPANTAVSVSLMENVQFSRKPVVVR